MTSPVEEIKARLDILDVVREYVPELKRSGANWKARCPFHAEKSPSFMVHPGKQIFHCFGCLLPGQLVKTPFGYHDIATLDEHHFVYSGQGNIRKILTAMSRQYEGEVVDIQVRKLGGVVSLTTDHRLKIIRPTTKYFKKTKQFYRRVRAYSNEVVAALERQRLAIERFGTIMEVSAGELLENDFVLYPIRTTTTPIKKIDLSDYLVKQYIRGPHPPNIPYRIYISDDFLKLIGYYIAEGSNHRAYIRFSLGNHEEDFAQEIVQLIKKIFGLYAKIHRRSGRKTGLEITACHSFLADIFANFCGKGSQNKHIPFVFQELPPTQQMVLVEAVRRGDGHTYLAQKSTRMHHAIGVVSRILTEQIIDILLRNDIFPSFHITPGRADSDGTRHKESYTVIWSTEAKAQHTCVYPGSNGSSSWLLPVRQITRRDYYGPVYNLMVEEDHSYIATNFAVSNCGKGGDMFEFVQKIEGIEFPDALRILAAKANVILERVDPALTSARTRMLDLLNEATLFFVQSLNSPAGAMCRQYLFEQRHMAPEVAKDWQLGFAPASWDALSQHLFAKRYNEQEIVAAGLALARDPSRGRGIYDRFRNRLIFPIRNSSGQVVGFSARVLPGATDEEPKYVNTPQTLVYDKGKILFGYDRARDAIRKAGFVVVVEGQFDLVSSHAAGITHTVAVSGTALTEDHLRLLRRMTDTIALSFDMDLAGVAAATRSIDLALAEGFTVKIIELPEGLKDPDECIQRDPVLWTQAVAAALPFVEVAFARATRGKNLADVEQARSAITTLMPIIRKLSSRVDQSLWIHRLADATSMNEAVLADELVRGNRGVTSRPQAQSPVRDVDDTNDLAERYLGLLNLTRNPLPWVKQLTGEVFPPGEHRDLANAFTLCYSTHIPTSLEEVIKTIEGQSPTLAAFAQLINLRVQDVYATLTPDGIEEELAHLARHLERRMLHRQLRQLEQNLREAERLAHHEKVAAVSAEFARLTERLHTL